MYDVASMKIFVRVVQRGSFSAAAQELNLTPSAVSKKISRVETDLDVRLINRSTHELYLTEAGQVFYDRCLKILREIDLARDAVHEASETLTGTLKIHLTPGTGHQLVLPVLSQFMKANSQLDINLVVQPIAVDVLRDGFDLSIRSSTPDDTTVRYTSVESRALFQGRYLICASPAYFRQHGKPKTPQDLVDHNCLLYVSQPSFNKWWFKSGGRSYGVTVNGTFHSDDWFSVRTAACEGFGIARLLSFDHELQPPLGPLEVIFEKEAVCDRTIWALYPRTSSVPRKVTAFLDFLSRSLESRKRKAVART